MNTLGIYSSIIPRSLENLFKILPQGLALKNRIVALTILEKTKSCKCVEARKQNIKKYTECETPMTIIPAVKPLYIYSIDSLSRVSFSVDTLFAML